MDRAQETFRKLAICYAPRHSQTAEVSGKPNNYIRGFFLGTPFVWQSRHLTVWMLWGLLFDLNVVSMASTLRPQLESCGWQVVHEARVL